MLGFVMCSVLTSVAFGVSTLSTEALGWIRASDKPGDFHFYDEHGRVRIFHGSNRVQKSPPWYIEEMYASDAVASHTEQLGFTVVRLGFMWSGYNPAPNVFNQTYIDVIKATVGRLAKRGVYSLLNVQMDGLSSKFGTYDGAPLWVVNKSVSKHAFPWPLSTDDPTGHLDSSILTEASAAAYQDLFDNRHGMLDDFVAFWSHAAEQFKDVPGVIGYDVINEPFAGNFYQDPSLLLPGVAGKKNLQRMYDILAEAIRKHDDRHIIFYEPVSWGMIFSNNIAGSGFEHVPGGDAYRNRSAYSYHYYCHSFLAHYNDHPLQRIVCDDTLAPLVYRAVHDDVKRLGGAAMQTEGMQCGGVQSECENQMSQLDKNLFSWVDWNFGMANDTQAASWARTYAHAVAGAPVSMSFDRESKAFDFCFRLDLAIRAPTEIFASTTFSYQTGLDVSASDNVKAAVDGDRIFVTPTSNAVDESEACVHVRRKAKALLYV